MRTEIILATALNIQINANNRKNIQFCFPNVGVNEPKSIYILSQQNSSGKQLKDKLKYILTISLK